ncbi:MAG: toll/interleukin-1 receptor domain-containing protein [Anaerolineae bacterium]
MNLSTIFISYRRRESSAFALLVLARLKEHGLDAFLDMTIKPGDTRYAHIKEQIESCDFFIVLLNHETLDSHVVRDEIQWAMDAKKVILPITHPHFEYAVYREKRTQEGKFEVSPEMDAMLTNTHTIRVLEASALAYNTAIVELSIASASPHDARLFNTNITQDKLRKS